MPRTPISQAQLQKQRPRPEFEHLGDEGYRNFTSGLPSPVLSAAWTLGLTAPLLFLVATIPEPFASTFISAQAAAAIAPGLTWSAAGLCAIATVGFTQIIKRRNGGRAVALAFTPVVAAALLLWSSWYGFDIVDSEDLWIFAVPVYAAVKLCWAASLLFGRTARDWFAEPLGTYEGERPDPQPQTPLAAAIPLATMWTAFVAVPPLTAIPWLPSEPLSVAGLDPEQLNYLQNAAVVGWNWTVLQAVALLGLLTRRRVARLAAIGVSLATALAGTVLAALAWHVFGSAGTGVVIVAVVAAPLLWAVLLSSPPARGRWHR
ncbi:hypothetical protein [Glycomyces sp. NPDC048151]|uniref:hypothetical protein n=1 Tax=Glycomyces sp. NPDC048151 TaxID=3364002 RepID=UPI0037219817